MTHYRFYILDISGTIHKGSSLELADDSAAFAEALALSKDGPIEVWDGTRKVCFIDQNVERRVATG